jgi:hypothetical protein
LCEIREFRNVEGKARDTNSLKGWVKIITQQARLNMKWFYLPKGGIMPFQEKMGVDFLVTLRLSREDLESYRDQRKGRLNSIARQHFRERIAEFFRRYPYDEWYPLDVAEFGEYKRQYPDSEPFEWQRA